MKPSPSKSVCRRCRYYVPEGRRGGQCQQLNVSVQGAWAACSLAIPPFTPAWESVEDIMVWQQKTLAAMQDSAIAESLQEPICAGETATHSQTRHVNQRSSADASLSGSTSRALSSFAPSSEQTLGIKALWM